MRWVVGQINTVVINVVLLLEVYLVALNFQILSLRCLKHWRLHHL